jgi:hypothetical protein
MRSHLQPLLRTLLGRLYLRRFTLTDYLRPRKEVRGHSRGIQTSTNQYPVFGCHPAGAVLCQVLEGLDYCQEENKCPDEGMLDRAISSILQCKLPIKHKDPGCPTISCMIGVSHIEKALLNLGASVNLLPYSVYIQLGLGELKPTSMTLQLADRSVKVPRGIIEDVLIKVDKFYFPVDFIVLDTEPV